MNTVNTVMKTILATSAALALVGGVILAPLAAHGESDTSQDQRTSTSQQRAGGQQTTKPSPPQQRQQPTTKDQKQYPSDGTKVRCTGTPPKPEYYPGTRQLTNESIAKFKAAGCVPTDGTAFGYNELPKSGKQTKPTAPSGKQVKPKAPSGKPSTTQPPTKLPRVAG